MPRPLIYIALILVSISLVPMACVVVNWTNEEGTRFAPAMLASGVFAGKVVVSDEVPPGATTMPTPVPTVT